MGYPKYDLREELTVRQLVTFVYKEFPVHFRSRGESHDFWEFVYVDKGKVEIEVGTGREILQQGDMIFYTPNEFHVGHALDGTAPNLLIVSFVCDSPAMRFFEGKTFRLKEGERRLLSCLLQEGREAFDPPVDSPLMSLPRRNRFASFGSEQVIRNYLEILLIQLIRTGERGGSDRKPFKTVLSNENKALAEQIIAYMREHLSEELSIDKLCSQFQIGRTRLITLFKEETGGGAMACFGKQKIEQAKSWIREEKLNMTEIGERLGYSSIHSFSRSFKQAVGMTPTEYARSVHARSVRGTKTARPADQAAVEE
ncbi:AraC family transcriptional regulator [Paenibacillus sp. SAFN-117]|uniref:AraC family transcriptional regulator n=1 Tax=Paenibacillus sp. SAFN-117 TaxID=3436860 RepID=UPI003F7CF8D2